MKRLFSSISVKFAVLISALVLSISVLAQDIEYPDSFNQPMALFDSSMGDFHFPISSDNALAQAYFDQGFQLMYSYAKDEAARSFQAAHFADPDCAICYWGEAWSWGSYLNGAMTTGEAPRAYYAEQQALARIQSASPREADMIRALQPRYVEDFHPETRRVQDQAYSDAMRDLSEKYPDDLDIGTLYADSLFLMEERRGYRDLNDPNVIRLHAALLRVLEKDIRHPGSCHLLVHATESTATPELAAPCARYLGSSIPGASHINHMPSHTWNEMGLWHDAVRANILAWQSDQKAAIGEGFAIYPTHNLTMLFYAASMGGESAAAIQAAKDLAKLNNSTGMHAMVLVRFGRFDEVLDITEAPNGEVNLSMFDFSQGYAALKTGDTEKAKQALLELKQLTETTTARFRFHDGKNIVGTLAGILEGEIAWSEGNMEAAAAAFRLATDYYDSLNYDEPEPLPFSPRHWLGAAYMQLGAYDNALEVYRTDLQDHPHNIWSLYGVQQALLKKGESDPLIDRDLYEATTYADIWIPDSKL
jgi:tetratricopeptide (TPR) repeat protein